MNAIVTYLVTFGSIVSMGFGVWHFFVPKLWKWNAYIDPKATELVLAIRAINVFFSLSLVLFGILSLALIYHKPYHKFSIQAILLVCSLLWLTRVTMQIIFPQGSSNLYLQYGMLLSFIFTFGSYFVSYLLVLKH